MLTKLMCDVSLKIISDPPPTLLKFQAILAQHVNGTLAWATLGRAFSTDIDEDKDLFTTFQARPMV